MSPRGRRAPAVAQTSKAVVFDARDFAAWHEKEARRIGHLAEEQDDTERGVDGLTRREAYAELADFHRQAAEFIRRQP